MSSRSPRSRPFSSRILARILRSGLALLLSIALAASLACLDARPARAETPADARILLNQKRMEIRQLIELVSKETGRTILFDEQVRGVVSLVAKRPVTPDEAWEILGEALQMLGFSLLPSTVDQWRIARIAEAVGESPFVGTAKRESDLYVTALIPLDFANLQSVMNVLQPLGGSSVTLVMLEDSNSLIASGPERAIARLTAIADELDRVEERKLRQRVLRYRSVLDVEPMIQAQFDSGALLDRDLEVWSDERTNSVIFRGEEEAVDRIVAFLEKIDEPVEGEGEIRVLRILNRDAAEIAGILGGQVPASAGASKNSREDKNRDRSDAKSESDATRKQEDTTREGLEGSNATPEDGLAVEAQAPPESVGSGAPIDLATLLGGEDYSIAVDGPTRSLVVRASERGHVLIRELVEELDARPQLIAVDVTVSEIRTPSTWALALSYHVPLLPGDALDEYVGRLISLPAGRGFGSAPIDQGALFGRVSHDAGVDFDVPGEGGVQVPLEDTGEIDASDRKFTVDILIQPSLVLVAGEQNEIFVGANVPIPVSEASSLGGTTTTGELSYPSATVTFNREDIGIRMNLEAQAGKEGPIQLDLEIELSDVGPPLAGDVEKVGPTLIKEALSAKARLEDGQTAIVGIYRNRKDDVAQGGAPWLSDIPFLGWLFKARGEVVVDTKLVIAARARRISTPAELVADTIRRRLAFDRQRARSVELPEAEGSPYGVRVTTRSLEEDADAIAQDLERKGHSVRIHRWTSSDRRELFDVYVMGFDSMVDAGDLAQHLAEDGWDADLVVFPARS